MNEQNNDPLNDLMKEAYPAPDAPERLAHRMSEIAEQSPRAVGRMPARGRLRFPLVAAGALMAVAAIAAFQYFFGRTGEAAIALIPSDAGLVISLDTNPSQSQLAVYQRIGAALKREGLDTGLANLVKDGLGDKPIVAKLREQLTLNFAIGVWPPSMKQGKESTIALFAVKDGKAVERILREEAQLVDVRGYAAYKTDGVPVVFSVIDNYLVAASDSDAIARVYEVKAGQEPSITSLGAYREARGSLPADANLMVFVSPKMINEGAMALGKASVPSPKWFSMGAALREGGIQFDWRSPIDAQSMQGIKHLAGVRPLDMTALRKLPEGAYGLIGISQLGQIVPAIEDSTRNDPDTAKSVDSGVKDFEKETGLSVEHDIVPALGGDVIFAAYPGPSGAGEDVDGMVLADDANGSNPAELAAKVRTLIERESAKSKDPVHFEESQIAGVTVWSLDEKTTKALQGEGNDSSPMKNKSVFFAALDRSVVVTSSKALLNRAIVASHGGTTLADDSAFATMATQIKPDSQFVMMVCVGRIMERAKSVFKDVMGSEQDGDIVRLFGGANAGLVASGRVDGDEMQGSVFVPLDYDRLAKWIHTMKDGKEKPLPVGSEISDPSVIITR